jgi:hypothetical protein
VLGLNETRWLQTEQLRLSSGEQLLYSGHTEDGAPHMVTLLLTPEAQLALIGLEPVNSHIIKAKYTYTLFIFLFYVPLKNFSLVWRHHHYR